MKRLLICIVACVAMHIAAGAQQADVSRMDRSKVVEQGFTPLPDWKDALRRYLAELGQES